MAPVVRLARFESLGREEECVGTPLCSLEGSAAAIARSRFECATFWRKAFRPVK